MDKVDIDNSLPKKKSQNVKKNNTSESIEKLTIRTKNGLVNGIAEEKNKGSKKHNKINTSTIAIKEVKYNKNSDSPATQSHDTINNQDNCSNSKNCVSENNCTLKEDLNPEDSQKINQSEISNKIQTKRKKKSKTNKSEKAEDSNCNLPKFDKYSLINSSVNSESLIPEITETPSTSKLWPYPNLLEYQDDSTEFEKNLIESIKSLKIQQEAVDLSNNKKELSETSQQLEENECEVSYVQYESELQMPLIMKIIQKDLSEPYSIYTYRYFIHNWPKLCFLAMCQEKCVGAIVCKLDFHRKSTKRGYIAMLAVDKDFRKRKIGSTLVRRAIAEMIDGGADEVVLETEVTNKSALRLYEQLGFVRDKRLFRYYLNGVDALRLKLWLR